MSKKLMILSCNLEVLSKGINASLKALPKTKKIAIKKVLKEEILLWSKQLKACVGEINFIIKGK